MKKNSILILSIILISTSTIKAQIPTNGLVAWYPFSGNANDSSGNGNKGTVYGASLTTDRFGNRNSAYFFNGYSTILVPHNNLLNLTGDFTISSWFKVASYVTKYNTLFILSKNDGDTGVSGYTYGIWKILPFKINFQANPFFNSNTYPDSSGIVSDTNWNHFVTVYSKSKNILSYYLNNQLISNINISFDVKKNTLPLYIGSSPSIYNDYLGYFNGSIDDISIYNVALDSKGVDSLYHESGYRNSLPVKIENIAATYKDGSINLNWTDANEINIANFNIQRSIYENNFITIGTKSPKGEGNYLFTDKNLTKANTLYYRLEIINKDGSKQYSVVKEVNIIQSNQKFNIYPNPTKDKITIDGNINQIKIIDITGKVLIAKETSINTTTIDVSQLVKGLYFIQYRNVTGEVKTEKLVVE